MKQTVSLVTAALFAGALAAPVLAQSPGMEASPAASPSMAAPTGEMSPGAEESPMAHHRRHHRMRHHRHHAGTETETTPSSEMSPPAAKHHPRPPQAVIEYSCDQFVNYGAHLVSNPYRQIEADGRWCLKSGPV